MDVLERPHWFQIAPGGFSAVMGMHNGGLEEGAQGLPGKKGRAEKDGTSLRSFCFCSSHRPRAPLSPANSLGTLV